MRMRMRKGEEVNKISGTVSVIEETKTFGAKGFRKRLVVIEQELGSFTNVIPIEFTRDACDTVDQLHVGDSVTIEFRLSGRKWQKDQDSEVRYFLSAEASSLTVDNAVASAAPVATEYEQESDLDCPF